MSLMPHQRYRQVEKAKGGILSGFDSLLVANKQAEKNPFQCQMWKSHSYSDGPDKDVDRLGFF